MRFTQEPSSLIGWAIVFEDLLDIPIDPRHGLTPWRQDHPRLYLIGAAVEEKAGRDMHPLHDVDEMAHRVFIRKAPAPIWERTPSHS
jgi:hypothetical protein